MKTVLFFYFLSLLLEFSLNAEGRLVVVTPHEQRVSLESTLNDGYWHVVEWTAVPLIVTLNSSLSTQMLFTGRYSSWDDDSRVVISVGAKASSTGTTN